MAGSAFKDEETVKLVTERFTPVLVDGDVEKDWTKKFGVNGFPAVIFVDQKGETVGKVVGAAAVPQFRSDVESAAKKAGKPRPSKDYKVLTKAKEELDEALAADKPRGAISAIEKIEKVGREGRILDAAKKAREQLLTDCKRKVDEAVKAGESGDAGAALKSLKRIILDYKGLDEALEESARKAIADIEAAQEAEKDDAAE